MPQSVAKVQTFAQSLFMRILSNNLTFYLDGMNNEIVQILQAFLTEASQFTPISLICYQPVLKHLCQTTSHFLSRKRLQIRRINNYQICRFNDSNLILKRSEIHPCFTSHSSIYHGQQGGGDI